MLLNYVLFLMWKNRNHHSYLKVLRFPKPHLTICSWERPFQSIDLNSKKKVMITNYYKLKRTFTLNPIVSNMTMISLSRGPICLLGNSSLWGNNGPSGLAAELKHLALMYVFRYLIDFTEIRYILERTRLLLETWKHLLFHFNTVVILWCIRNGVSTSINGQVRGQQTN